MKFKWWHFFFLLVLLALNLYIFSIRNSTSVFENQIEGTYSEIYYSGKLKNYVSDLYVDDFDSLHIIVNLNNEAEVSDYQLVTNNFSSHIKMRNFVLEAVFPLDTGRRTYQIIPTLVSSYLDTINLKLLFLPNEYYKNRGNTNISDQIHVYYQ